MTEFAAEMLFRNSVWTLVTVRMQAYHIITSMSCNVGQITLHMAVNRAAAIKSKGRSYAYAW